MSPLDAFLPFGLTAETLLMLLVAGATFASIMATWSSLTAGSPVGARIEAVARRREELRGLARQPAARRERRQRGTMSRIVSQLKLARVSQTEKLRLKLLRAGLRDREGMVVYLFCKPVLPMVFGAAGAALVYGMDFGGLPAQLKPAACAAAALLGFYGPDLYLDNLAKKRQHAIAKALPDGLDLLVICAEAGLSLDTALNRVAEEIAPSAPELAEEVGLTSVELNFLPERRQALANLAKRVDLPAVRGAVNTLMQTEKYGTPLSQSLRVLSAEFREQRMLRAEEKAARLPATLTVPMIVFILPTLFIVLAGPAMLQVYDNLIKG
jgi:tight adherence protein C